MTIKTKCFIILKQNVLHWREVYGVVGKVLLRAFAVLIIVGGIILIFLGNEIQEINQPYSAQFGYVMNGETVIYDSGAIGGNLESVEDGEALEAFGFVLSAAGAVLFLVSFFIKTEQDR